MLSLLQIRAIGALALLAALAMAVHLLLASERRQGAAQCKADQAAAAVAFNARTVAADAAQAAQTAKAVQDGQDKLVTVAAAAGNALGALDRLRQRAAADAGRRAVSCPAAVAGSGATAGAAVAVQPDVLGRLGEATRQLAAYGDELRTKCEIGQRATAPANK